MADWDLWVHGINTQVEKTISGMSVRRVAWGTVVSQPANTSNWFHLAIPSFTAIAGDTGVVCSGFWFKAKLNQNARVIGVHAWVNDKRVAWLDAMDLRGPVVDFASTAYPMKQSGPPGSIAGPGYQLRDTLGTGGGLVVSVAVQFLTGSPTGEVTFTGAAARYHR